MTQETGVGFDRSGPEISNDGKPVTALVVSDGLDDWMIPDAAFPATGCEVLRADGVAAAARVCAETPPDLVIMPVTVGGQLTSQQLKACLAQRPAPVVVVTASNDQINTAAEAMRTGAYDCLFKPFSLTRLTRTIEGAIKQIRRGADQSRPARRRSAAATGAPARTSARATGRAPVHASGHGAGRPALHELSLARRGFVASSPQMKSVLAKAAVLAGSDAPVFVSGEVGTGKNTLAEIVHQLSGRAEMPFVTLSCAALTEETFDEVLHGRQGAIGRAMGGTLYLDEVFDLEPAAQPKLLELIEKARGNGPLGAIRFIAGSGRDPRAVLRDGRFRSDLYYRLHVAPLALPPLRAREGDLALIARTRLAEMSEAEGRGFVGFSDAAMTMLAGHDWPGNLRELINLIWSVVLMNEGPLVTPDQLPPELRGASPRPAGVSRDPRRSGGEERDEALADEKSAMDRGGMGKAFVGRTLAEIERAAIEATIEAEAGSVPRAARVLDVSPSTLYRKREAWARRSQD